MKKLIFSILYVFLVLCLTNSAKAGVSISSFSIPSQYLNGNLQFVPKTGAATPFTANFTLARAGDTYNSVIVSLILVTSGSTKVISTASISHLGGDWGSSPVWESSISGSLPAGITSGNIYLQMTAYDGTIQGATSQSVTSTNIYNSNSVPGGNNPPPSGNNPFPINDPRYIKPFKQYKAGAGAILTSGTYHLDFQNDGNLVLYKNGYTVMWSANIVNLPGAVLNFNSNGMVVIIDTQGVVRWNGNPDLLTSVGNCYWTLQADGNFVGYQSYRTAVDGSITPYGDVIGSTRTENGIRSPSMGTLQ